MALKTSITASGLASISDAHGAVAIGQMTSTIECVAHVVSVFGDKLACNAACRFTDGAGSPVAMRSYQFVPSVADGAPNFIRQAYLHLKSLPEFAGATDC
jgi:hypothetical protein